MSLTRRIMPYVAWVFTHPRTRDGRRFVAEQRRRLSGQPHRIRYFHQVDDPYSQLVARVLAQLVERYDVEIEPYLVGPPPDEAAPERERLEAFARKDAADVAPFYGLDFPDTVSAPAAADVELATRLLAAAIEAERFTEEAARIGSALWQGDAVGLQATAEGLPLAEPDAAQRAVEEGSALRARTGHYLGAMLHYGDEWYWGVDRLHFLERRLQDLGLLRTGAPAEPIAPRPALSTAPQASSAHRLRLEYYPSLRSPYTAIAMRRVMELATRLPVELVLRPVLPMVMRGLPVPSMKRMYITLDTMREAEDAGEPFGFVCDPVGRPVERAYSLFPWARERGRAGEFLHAFTHASFAQGIDTGTDEGLCQVVEQAGLSWQEAREHVDANEDWREELEENRIVMFESGLWGVPSFRLLDEHDEPIFCTWGQDRIWLVEHEIRRHLEEESAR